MKRALSWLLVLVMVFSMLPLAAFADEAVVWTVAGSYEAEGGKYYEFAPNTAGKYTVTASDGVKFAIDNGMGFVLGSDLEIYETEMQGDGGSMGITPNANTVVTITYAEAKPPIVWEKYTNKVTPTLAMNNCLVIGERTPEMPFTTLVNFNHSVISITAMLNSGAAKYASPDYDIYIDYTDALLEYTNLANSDENPLKGYFVLTEDLMVMLKDLDMYKGWSDYVEGGWLGLLVDANYDHTPSEAVVENGYEIVSCSKCGAEISKVEIETEPVPGESAENPIYAEWNWNEEYTEATYEVTLGNGTWYFADWSVTGMDMTVNGEAFEYIPGAPRRSPATWTIINDGAEAKYTFVISFPAGTMNNPAELQDENVASVEAGSQGYFYTWTAEKAGYLTVIAEGENYTFTLNNYTSGIYGDAQFYSDYAYMDSIAVNAGDEVTVVVGTEDWSAGEITLYASFSGDSAENPFTPEFVWNDEGSAASLNLKVPVGTIYYASRVNGLIFTANGEPVEYTAGDNRMPATWSFTNNTEAMATYALELSYPVGASENPDALVIGESVVELEEGNSGYHFTWVAPEDTELTVSVSGDSWSYIINKTPADPEDWSGYVYGETHTNGDDPVVASETIAVKAGETVQVSVQTYNPEDPYGWFEPLPAGKITVVASLAGSEEGPCKHESLEHVAAVAPSCYENGNIEYWVCYDCECVWANEALTQLTNIKNVVAPAAHTVEHVAESCYNTEYWVCNKCQTYWADENQFIITNSKNVIKAVPSHKAEHTAESCYNTEYWYCEACDTYFADEALTQITNRKNVIKAVPSHKAEHTAESCYNTEYWYCEACDTYFADEALTQITNSKNVIKAVATHDLKHVEAAAPSCQNGNIEYWYCEACEIVWADEALTQITNFKNVIVPATGAHVIDTDTLVWSWATVKEGTKSATNKGVIATASAFCSGCNAEVVLTAEVSDPRTIVATHKDYNNIKTEYHYYTATVTFEGKEYSNVMVIVDPTCRHVGFTGYFGRVQIGNTVKVFPEFKNDYDVGSGWGIYNVVAKEAHNWVEKGKPGDADYVKYCSECALDYKNVATGDAIMFSVIIMILAGAAVVVMLSKKRRVA